MVETEVKFEREKQDGIVPVGTYLIDAAKRFGIRFEDDCVPEQDLHFCSAIITKGSANLSAPTKMETEHFANHGRRDNERLTCQARIEKPGEVIIMTEEKKEAPAGETPVDDSSEKFKKEFTEMPLEKKIANLVRLEAIALGETFSFILNSPFQVFDKVVDVMAEFGFKKEEAEREAKRPAEHKKAERKAKPRSKTKRKPSGGATASAE
jgi:ferredoxin